jgi:GT2 family glycosyltransferase
MVKSMKNEQKILNPKVSVICVMYNSKEVIDVLLRSLFEQTYPNTEIILVDNASRDGCSDYVVEKYSSARVIRSTRNLGYGGGANLGISHASGEYVFIVNDDVMVSFAAIEELVSFLQQHPKVGAVQPKLRSLSEKERFEYAGAAGGMLDLCGYPFCRGRLFYSLENDTGQYEKPAKIFWASGAAFMARKAVIERLGSFDASFGLYHEETDLCWRLHLSGYEVAYVPSAVVYHVGSRASKKYFPFRQLVNIHRNNFYMLIKNSPLRKLMVILPVRVLFEAGNIVYLVKRGEALHVMAILKSIVELLSNARSLLEKRRQNANLINNGSRKADLPIYPIPVLVEYFLLRRLRYPQLRFAQLQPDLVRHVRPEPIHIGIGTLEVSLKERNIVLSQVPPN